MPSKAIIFLVTISSEEEKKSLTTKASTFTKIQICIDSLHLTSTYSDLVGAE